MLGLEIVSGRKLPHRPLRAAQQEIDCPIKRSSKRMEAAPGGRTSCPCGLTCSEVQSCQEKPARDRRRLQRQSFQQPINQKAGSRPRIRGLRRQSSAFRLMHSSCFRRAWQDEALLDGRARSPGDASSGAASHLLRPHTSGGVDVNNSSRSSSPSKEHFSLIHAARYRIAYNPSASRFRYIASPPPHRVLTPEARGRTLRRRHDAGLRATQTMGWPLGGPIRR